MIKRKAYYFIEKALNEKRIPIIIGMRRIGKTTMLEQYKKSYSNADIIAWDSWEFQILTDEEFYAYIENLCSKGGTLLFDEVQARKSWDIFIKNMWDRYVSKNICKIVVTGSSSMILAGKDLGVTRTEKILVDTWNFNEYSEFVGCESTIENFENFLGYGFPEFMNKESDYSRMLNLTLKPIIEDDIPKAYPGIDTLALMRFISSINNLTNGEVNETSLALKVGISIPTVRKYIDILEKALLIKKIYRIHPDGTHPKKKQYKVFLNPHIQIWIHNKPFKNINGKSKGHIIESYWLHWAKGINGFNKTFYYVKDQSTNKEIDFASMNSDGTFKTLHEFKYSDQVNFSDLKTLISTKSINKLVWCKNTKQDHGIKFISILDIENN